MGSSMQESSPQYLFWAFWRWSSWSCFVDGVAPLLACKQEIPCVSVFGQKNPMLSARSDSKPILQPPISGAGLSQPNCCECEKSVIVLLIHVKKNMVLRLTEKWKCFDCERLRGKSGSKMVTRLTARYDYTTECPARWNQMFYTKCNFSSKLTHSLMSHDYKSSSPITSTSTRCFTAVSLNEHVINMFPRKLM